MSEEKWEVRIVPDYPGIFVDPDADCYIEIISTDADFDPQPLAARLVAVPELESKVRLLGDKCDEYHTRIKELEAALLDLEDELVDKIEPTNNSTKRIVLNAAYANASLIVMHKRQGLGIKSREEAALGDSHE